MSVTENPILSFAARVSAARQSLSRAELHAAVYMKDHPQDVLFESVSTLGKLSKTSDATVVRAIQSLGYRGFADLKRELGRELVATVAPSDRLQERLERSRVHQQSTIATVVEEAIARLEQTRDAVSPEAFQSALEILSTAHTVFTWGLGASSHEAQYAALRLRRLGQRSVALSATGFHLGDELLLLREGDALLLYVRGRRLVDVTTIVEAARAVGAKVVLVSGFLASEYQDSVNAVLETQDSRPGVTREALAASVVTDALMLALADANEDQAVKTSQRLSDYRGKLIGPTANRRNLPPDGR
jgi:DNA-binding MurR/RpiR family transcriptional regulator